MKKIILLLIICLPEIALCQDLTGTWEGSGGGTTYIKMVITHRHDSLIGYTYDEGGGYCKATFIGHYDKKLKRLTGHGVKMIESTPNHVLVDYDFIYSREPRGQFLRENIGEEGFLERMLGPNSREYLKKTSNKVDLPVPVTRKVTPPVSKKIAPVPIAKVPVKTPVQKSIVNKPAIRKSLPVKSAAATVSKSPVAVKKEVITAPVVKQAPVIIRPAPAALIKKKEERTAKLVQTIYTAEDTVKISVYDNGEVDGDTVTVFFDNSVVLDRYMISEKAKEISLPVSKDGQEHYIELFANNLGTIPPNTALIIITAGKKRYELHASYDLKTNARIIVQYKE